MKNTLVIILVMCSAISYSQLSTLIENKIKPPKYTEDIGSGTLAQSDLFNEVAPTGYDLLNANLTFTDKDQVQKVGFSPLKLSDKYYYLLSNLRLNFSNKSGALTGGISIGNDNSAYESRRVQTMLNNLTAQYATGLPALPAVGAAETNDEYRARVEQQVPGYQAALTNIANDFENQRLKHVFKYSIGYNAQFFSILESKSNDTNYDSINYHGFKGHNVFLNGSYSFKNGCILGEVAINYFNKRKAADSLQVKNEYYGYSIAVTKRLFKLISLTNLATKDFYIASRFIPSIYLGLSYEQLDYQGNNYIYAEENAKSINIITPYLDVRISPAAQFRISFPIKNTDEYLAGSDGKKIAAILSFNYKLINLSN